MYCVDGSGVKRSEREREIISKVGGVGRWGTPRE